MRVSGSKSEDEGSPEEGEEGRVGVQTTTKDRYKHQHDRR